MVQFYSDSNFADFNLYKLAMAIPMLLAAALVTYISYQFYWVFLPDYYKLDSEAGTFMPLLLRVAFLYFSIMTYVFLFRTFTMNPGYLPSWL